MKCPGGKCYRHRNPANLGKNGGSGDAEHATRLTVSVSPRALVGPHESSPTTRLPGRRNRCILGRGQHPVGLPRRELHPFR